MLNVKTNENFSFLGELQSFFLALLVVSTFFFVGINSFHFNHSVNSISAVDELEINTETISYDKCHQVENKNKNLIVEAKLNNCLEALPTINTETPFVKSNTRLTKKLKIKDPVIVTPPTGLSSSIHSVKIPVKTINSSVITKQEPTLGISKPYVINRTLTRINPPVVHNNMLVNSPVLTTKKAIKTKKSKKKSVSIVKMSELSELLASSMETAEANNKMIMLSFGAKWCAPCKQMENNVYTNSEVKSLISENYIHIKLTEKEFEAITLKQLYNVKVYPTTLILDSEGIETVRYEEGLSTSRMLAILNDHIPANQTTELLASTEIEQIKAPAELINSATDYLLKRSEESHLGLMK